MPETRAPELASATASQAADAVCELTVALRAGRRRAIAEMLSLVEQEAPLARDVLRTLSADLGRALVVGVTGPPGAGKSTLVAALIGFARRAGHKVAVLAVDPSSPVSGGAILGDRLRMTEALDDDGVFVRSLASQGYLGGLTPAAVRMIDALDAAGFGVIVLETVGTGQSEIDVADVADIAVVVAAPGLGDGIQAMKAGLLEVADILVVNKAERDGAERTVHELQGAIGLRAAHQIPVLRTSAVTGAGVEGLWDEIATLGASRLAVPPLERRRRRARYLIARAAADLVATQIRASGGDGRLDELADAVLAGELDPQSAARQIRDQHPERPGAHGRA